MELLKSTGKRQGKVLIEIGALTAQELLENVKEQVVAIVWSLFEWTEGTITFKVGKFKEDELIKLSLDTRFVVLEGIKKISDPKRVVKWLGKKEDVFEPSENALILLPTIPLSTDEKRIFRFVDGRRTLLMLLEVSPLDTSQTAKILYALFVLGLIKRKNQGLSRSKRDPEKMLKISFLGGLGEFGRNMTLYEKDGHTLIVDCGMMFPETDLPGVDSVIPDFQYLMETRGAGGCALLITHAHEDHLGAVPFLLRQLPMPVMASPFALGLLENKLEEMDIELQEVRELSNGKKETFGPFEIEPIYVTHSIPEAFSMAIRTGDGTFVHSSDFKFDQTPLDGRLTSFNRFQDYGGMGVTALLVDSTNSEVGGMAGSEKTVFKGLESHISSAGERLIISLFSTNIQRIQGILDLASRYRKKVVFLGRSLLGNIEVSERLGHLRYPPNVVIGTEDIPKVRPSDMIVVATGSQGEPFSAMSRIAFDEIKNISIREGDTVIFSARIIPGNEKRIGRIINQVYRKGGRVVTPAEDPSIHVSGHGAQGRD